MTVVLAFDPVVVKLNHCAEFAGTFTDCEPVTAVAFLGLSMLPMVDMADDALELDNAPDDDEPLEALLDEALEVVPAEVVGVAVGVSVAELVLDEALELEALDDVAALDDAPEVGVAAATGPVTATGEPPRRTASPVMMTL